ncbi:MAG: molybdenum cofactor biosynthesis protein MoaE [Promethearchaeota archaeon]
MESKVINKEDARSFGQYIKEFENSLDIGVGGAIVSFTGVVRQDPSPKNEKVKTQTVTIECIEDLATEKLKEIAAKFENRPNIFKVAIIHFYGTFSIGEPMVHVLVYAAHRKEAFKTLEDVVDSYKALAPLWKKETYQDQESRWIYHEIKNDHS